MKKKESQGGFLDDLGPVGPFDHEIYARYGEALLLTIDALVDEVKTENKELEREIAKKRAVWLKGKDISIGEMIMVSFLQVMTRAYAEREVLIRIDRSWESGNRGVI